MTQLAKGVKEVAASYEPGEEGGRRRGQVGAGGGRWSVDADHESVGYDPGGKRE